MVKGLWFDLIHYANVQPKEPKEVKNLIAVSAKVRKNIANVWHK
jgi:hypothetical protein